MPERIDNRPLPKVHVVDLREEFKTRKALVFDGADGRDGTADYRKNSRLFYF